MSSIGTGYDLSVTTFSPDGRVFQIEYAAKAVDNSGTVIGIKCKDGIVLGVEKLITSKMMLPGSNRRIHLISNFWNLCLAVAGLAADGRQIVARAKSEATNFEKTYGEPMPVKELADRVASYVHLCTLYWWLRPFGCGVILGGYDRDGPQLYMVEPSGVSYRYFGAAIGKGRQAAKTEIEKLKLSEMTCREGVIEVAKIIYGVHDEAKDKAFELELSWVCDESNRQHQKVPDALLEEAKAAAKAALEEMDAD
ncbi:proteasome subunit alpha type-3-like [Asparagus officinalis]|uniref:proteasome subunit alpha type-3-like n=1 Tax=Asparagus officinalis TaxID=4686 RepID=UPI00098E21ED|nr:proteasome subunit alpha type-3-like [Asparagus officinalis]